MEELFDDVVKVQEEIKSALGPDSYVNPNQIFVRLEALQHESSSLRVSKVVKDLICELQAPPNFEEDANNNINGDQFSVYREGALNKSLDAEFGAKEPAISGDLDPGEVVQDLEKLEESSSEAGLRNDVNKVLRILADECGPMKEFEEVYAYLEAHIEKKNRVQVVVEEFLGMAEEMDEGVSRSTSLEIGQTSPLNKGKGKGKKTVTYGLDWQKIGANEMKVKLKKRERSPEDELSKKLRLSEKAATGQDFVNIVTNENSETPAENLDSLRSDPGTPDSDSSMPSRNYIAPSNLGTRVQDNHPNPTVTPKTPTVQPEPTKLTLPMAATARRDKTPSVEDRVREVLEIPDNDPAARLAERLSAMFPETPAEYILTRCQDLVGKNAAINRFTEELLDDPNPPANWKIIYSKPFKVFDVTVPFIEDMTQVDCAAPSSSNTAPNCDPSSSKSVADPDVDPVLYWETERQEQMVSMFPHICPEWLLQQVQNIIKNPVEGSDASAYRDLMFQGKLEELFSKSPEEKGRLPTRLQWETKMKQMAELEKWSGNMSVTDMLELYSDDPCGYFNDPQRKPDSEFYKQHALAGLRELYRFQSKTEIDKAFKKSNYLYTPAFKHLKQMTEDGKKTRKTRRTEYEIRYPADPCIEFSKEKKFCELEAKIITEKARRVIDRKAAVEAARLLDDLEECECCYSPDCLSEDMIKCQGGHLYCKECISRGTSVAIGDGKTIIECLGHCAEEIGWQELQKALAPNVLSKLLQRRQAEEVGAAGLESLVTCPFCPYQTIMENVDDKILACRNPDCGRDSCRLCKEPSHVPLRCEEVEKKEETRKKIEELQSEAMLRECWKCKTKYFKEEGCNKMACPTPKCGAKMCYLCKQPVEDYTHFYGQGGSPTATKTCPLWTDSKQLHEEEIASAAAKAKVELT